jgi:opacity protein-like surface antigen
MLSAILPCARGFFACDEFLQVMNNAPPTLPIGVITNTDVINAGAVNVQYPALLLRGGGAMIREMHFAYLTCIRLDVPACRVSGKCAIRGAAALALMLFSAVGVQAQCVSSGPAATSPGMAPWTGAIASGSASVAALVSSINSVNTAFLTQSNAFIGSPPNPQPDQQGGGVWTRSVGGHVDYGASATASNINLNGPLPGGVTCNTRSAEDFIGVQVGADIARLNANGWNLHAGVTTGFLGSTTRDATPQGPNPPGSFSNTLQVPFVGLYGAASYGSFLFDAQVRGDFYQNEVSDNSHGLYEQHSGAHGISVSGNVAYQHNLGNQWFIEPSAGLIWSRTHVDPLNFPGSLVFGTGALPPWILTVNDIDSTLGRFSLRAGTTVRSGSTVLQPFASLGVFHEFQNGVTSKLTSDYPAVGLPSQFYSSTISTSGIGTYGQFGLGVAAQIVDTGWVGYLRGDYRKGDNIEGWTVNGGLRYQFVPDPVATQRAMIAKAPVYKATVYKAEAQTAYNWTGFYVGAKAGAAWGFTNWNFPDGGINPRVAGFLGGGDIGYNYQAGNWVFGIEGDTAWTNLQGARPCPTGFFYSCEASINWLSSVTGRAGYAWDRNLAYVKAGAVIALGEAGFVCITGSQATTVPLAGCPEQSSSKTLTGWTAGLGYEFGLTRNISARGELMYFDLGSDGHNLAGTPSDLQRSGFLSTVGLHYRFGG